MRLPDRLWLAAALAAPPAVVGAVLLVLASDHDRHPIASLATGLFIGVSFVGSGLVAWWRRPDNHTGRLLALVGFTFFLSALTEANGARLFTAGIVVNALPIAALVHLILAYPSGTLGSAVERRLTGAAYVLAIAGQLATLLLDPQPAGLACDGPCPDNLVALGHFPRAERIVVDAVEAVAFVLFLLVVAVLVRRWRSASAAYRRSLRPVLLTGGATLTLFGADFVASAVSHDAGEAVGTIAGIALMTVPIGFLYGVARDRLARGGVAQLAVELERLGPGRLGDALRELLHDPTLVLAYRRPDGAGHVTLEGDKVELPPPGPGLTVIEPVAAIVHDPALHAEPELLASALATARLALENERLQAELAARLQELKSSHARGLEAALEERRRLERNLHDGAQQRLVSLALTLRMAQARLPEGSGAARELLDGASAELAQALEDLRELARGIHPAVLSERGLAAALESLVTRSRLRVDLARLPEERLPGSVEIAAYYVVAEALTNVAKYAESSGVVVSVERLNGVARIDVVDDGAGGADPARGSGLRGLSDRLALLGGRLEVASPAGAGTRVTAEIPVT
jgi:signal transduction histidine kinase